MATYVKVFMGSSFGDLLADDDTVLRRILRHGRRQIVVRDEQLMGAPQGKTIRFLETPGETTVGV